MRISLLLLTACCLLAATLILTYCSGSRQGWTVVSLPENTDTTDAYWKGIDLATKPPVEPLKVKEQEKEFLLPPGYAMNAVLSEPAIQQPAAITFDGNGRMYVLELRTYMLNLDSEGTLDPVNVISRWEDLDHDGIYETGGPFVDSLIFPRFVLPVGPNSILTMESNQDKIYEYTDTDGDGVADKKELFTEDFGRAGNVEHQQAFLYWGMDNWLYSTVNPFRIRRTPDGVQREPTASNHAQWGITHDDEGKLWFQGGSNGLPSYFQFPVHYGDYVVEENYAQGFEIPWGAPIGLADMQGGMKDVRMPDGSLNRVTGAAGNDIFRGHRLPSELQGQYFYGEPVARIVRQVNPVVKEGLTVLHNVYQQHQSEFIRSSDPLFRPVDMATAPDGSMYVVDMYHGIIQEGEWTPEGSYLRVKIQQYQLDKVVGLGRIWRLTYKDFERDTTQPHMYDESSLALLEHFRHPNGWWRDMAQQVLVQRRDQSVAPQLEAMVRTENNLLARFHALWALEGIGALKPSLVKDMMRDPNPRMRKQAMWAGETLYKAGNTSLASDYKALMQEDPDMEVRMRALMSGRLLKIPKTEEAAQKAMTSERHAGLQLVARQVVEPPMVTSFFGRKNPNFNEKEQALVDAGADIFHSLCSTCHGKMGEGTPLRPGELLAPSFIGSARVQAHPEYFIRTLLHGLTGAIEGKSYGGVIMTGMEHQDDEWIASVASFVRSNFENEASLIMPEDVARIRKQTEGRQKPYTYVELLASVPRQLEARDEWKITASHSAQVRKGSTSSPKGALNFEGWTTGITQQKDMWFQIELPEVSKLTEVVFVSPAISRGWREGSPPPIETYPREYNVAVSQDGQHWTEVVIQGKGIHSPTVIRFDPVDAKFLKISLTKSEEIVHGERRGQPYDYEVPWTMREFKLYALKK